MLQQEAGKIEEQVQIINSQIQEFEILKLSLEKLDLEMLPLQKVAKDSGLKPTTEILAPLGKGIFFKSELKDKELFVNVGNGIVVKKNPAEAGKVINKQIKQMEDIRGKLLNEIEKINFQLQELVQEDQKEKN